MMGIAKLDEDHAKILEAFNTLSQPSVYLDTILRIQVIEEFLSYATGHLTREEKLMRELEYPGYSSHRTAHSELQDAFMGLIKDILKGRIEHGLAVTTIRDTFIKHIETFDASLSDWLATPMVNKKKVLYTKF